MISQTDGRRFPGPSFNEGRSIHIGVNRVDEVVYEGCLQRLQSCEADARAMRDVADGMGFAARLLVSEDATRANVLDCLDATIERLVDGDVLMISYAGHMTSLSGVGDDRDGWDEAWCLHDGILVDDELHDLLSDVPAGVDVLVVTDSCFAGGIVDGRSQVIDAESLALGLGSTGGGTPDAVGPAPFVGSGVDVAADSVLVAAGDNLAPRTPRTGFGDLVIERLVKSGALPYGRARPASQRGEIVARVVSLAAAAEGSLALEGDKHGLFTAAIVAALERSDRDELTYGALMRSVAELLPGQTPTLGVFGRADASSVDSAAFGLATVEPARRPERTGVFAEIRALVPKK